MSLQDVLNFVTINGGNAGSSFASLVTSALTRIYNESATLRSALEARILTNNTLTITYMAGFAENENDSLTGSDIIRFDPAYGDSMINIDQYGHTDEYGYFRLFVHELCHALTGFRDGNYGFMQQGFSFLGPNVYYENIVAAEMGINNLRIGYYSTKIDSFDFLSSYTEGNQIGYAFLNIDNMAYVDASISIEANLNGLLIGLDGSESFDGGNGADYIYGMSGNDELKGNSGNDILYGGEGNDSLYGGVGDDRIYGDAGSDIIDGGFGIDAIDYRQSESSVVVNFKTITGSGGDAEGDSFSNIEAVNGSVYDDEFFSTGTKVEIFSGGAGDDIFNVSVGGRAPTIIWGGDGADTVAITSSAYAEAAGILVVTCDNITEENFHLVDLESLGFGDDFDWTAIDVVIINPDASDEISLDGEVIKIVNQTMTYLDYIPAHPDQEVVDEFISAGYTVAPSFPGGPDFLSLEFDVATLPFEENGSSVYTFNASFLGGSGHKIFTPNGGQYIMSGEEITWVEGFDPDLIGLQDYNVPVAPTVQPITVECSYTDDLGNPAYYKRVLYVYLSGLYVQPDGYDQPLGGVMLASISGSGGAINFGVLSVDSVDYTTPETLQRWYMVGGTISDSSIISAPGPTHSYSFSIADPEESQTGWPFGGSYGNGSLGSNMKTGDGINRLGAFDPVKQTVVVDGVALSASALTGEMTATEVNGSTVIQYGDDDFIVLRGVALADWQSGSAAQIHGSAGDDSISGTSADDVIASGGGNDVISAGAGDDRINYTSGDTVIIGNSANTGNDTLDLSRFNAEDVMFSVNGNDVVINTADGNILLLDQVLHDLGSMQANIETILLANESLDESGIRERAVYDQGTSDNDSIQGTAFDDAINGGAGDDTLLGNAGADSFDFAFGDGHDLIQDFSLAEDRLVFKWFELSDLTVSQVGDNTVITYGDDDSVTLLDIVAANLQTHHYEFV